MPATSPCNPCCSDPVVTNVPGTQGAAGTNGTNGVNAYTTVTGVGFVVPAIGSTVTAQLASSAWMVAGQVIVTDGPANFRVVSFPDSTSAVLTFLGQSGDVAPGVTIPVGARVSPSGVGYGPSLSVYASGTAYTVTATPALVDFGTTDPSITITSPGTWLIFSRARYDLNAATFAARTVTSLLRRTNNTASDLTNSSTSWLTGTTTTVTSTQFQLIPPILYVTANSNDIIQLWGSVSVLPSAGTLTVTEASIVAIKIA